MLSYKNSKSTMTAKMAASMVEQGEDAFRKLFKFYKRRNQPPDFSEVIDFSKKVGNELVYTAELNHGGVSEEAAFRAGLQPVKEWRAFGLQGYPVGFNSPGFIFISNPFLPGSQHYWVKQCLKTYTQKPNVCNLDMHMPPAETENIWDKSVGSIRKKGQREPRTLLEKLRWVTLGYHYNWDTKRDRERERGPRTESVLLTESCDCDSPLVCLVSMLITFGLLSSEIGQEEHSGFVNPHHLTLMLQNLGQQATYSPDHYTPFPEDLHSLSHKVAAACGFPSFNAEAGILNYYRSDSSLGIHVDESELDHTPPLLSFSFGQTAVFLLGGTKRQDPPTAMFMRSGDIMVMSGSSRLLYHAVPCIVPAPASQPLPSCLDKRVVNDESNPDSIVQTVCEKDWEVCSTYLKTSRINMTVRQVLGPGHTFPVTHTHTVPTTEQSGSDRDEQTQRAKKRKSGSGYDLDS
ncbi:hypothetical protein QTP70_022151 [Hemibagrus guttatus]|uniref:Fe2OG dioxygenase domain-containing protein n=1 Tax=Hemibagrus guttatus TaxID=175788 RepID=A0AAE0R121_9TELE|nr:hypothetical protein QTP70_022151 [Hemibagrus guttatus]